MLHKILLILAILFNVVAQVLLKKGAGMLTQLQQYVGLLPKLQVLATNYFFFLSLFFYGMSFLTYFFVLSRMQLSIAYIGTSVGSIVLISVLSMTFLHEPVIASKLIGIALCIAGIVIIFFRA